MILIIGLLVVGLGFQCIVLKQEEAAGGSDIFALGSMISLGRAMIPDRIAGEAALVCFASATCMFAFIFPALRRDLQKFARGYRAEMEKIRGKKGPTSRHSQLRGADAPRRG